MTPIIAAAALLLLLYISGLNWRKSVIFVMVFIVLEGVARKWILPGASNYIYFIKDFVLIGAYIKYFWVEGRKSRNHPINILIYVLAIWSLIQSFNPALGSFIVGIFGLRAYVLYVPLFWMLPDLFPSKMDIYIFTRNYSLMIIPVCLLAVAQFFSPPTSPLNFYTPETGAVATFGVGTEAIVRVTGPFPYISGFGVYVSASLTLLLPIFTLRQSPVWHYLTIAELVLLLGASFMTGSRSVILYEGLFLSLYIFVISIKHSNQALRNLAKFIMPAAIGSFIIPTYFGKSINLLRDRSVQNAGDVHRAWQPFFEPFEILAEIMKYKRLDSYGTASTHQATPMLRKLLQLPAGEAFQVRLGESESSRVGLEVGVVGASAWFLIRISLIIALLLSVIKLRDPYLSQLALAAFLFHALQITSNVIFNPSMGIYYWFFAGFVILLPVLEKREREQAVNIVGN